MKFPVPILIECPSCSRKFTHELKTAKNEKASKVTRVECYHCKTNFKVEIRWNIVKV